MRRARTEHAHLWHTKLCYLTVALPFDSRAYSTCSLTEAEYPVGALRQYLFSSQSDDNKTVLVLNHGSLFNHGGDNAQIGYRPAQFNADGPQAFEFYALRDIKAGEELTDDYATFEDIPWYEALCVEYGASSCVVVGRANRGPVKTRVKKQKAEALKAKKV